MGVICPSRASCLRWAAKGCAAATYNRGERGLSCAKPELTGNDGESRPLYRTLHCSPACRRDTQRHAAGPNPVLPCTCQSSSYSACRTPWRIQETPDTQAPARIPGSRPLPSGQGIYPLSCGPGEGSLGGIYDREERCIPPICQRFTKELGVGIQKVDRTVRGRVRTWAGALVQPDDGGVRDPAANSKASVKKARRVGPSRGQKAWSNSYGKPSLPGCLPQGS